MGLKKNLPVVQGPTKTSLDGRAKAFSKAKVIILGGGFGVYAALRLDKALARRADIEVTLINRNNFLLFTPG